MSEKLPKKKILFLASNPSGTVKLALNEEYKQIDEKLNPEQFDIKFFPDATYHDWVNKIFHHHPNIVHFSGHGTGTELQEENHLSSRKLIPLSSEKEGLYVEDEYKKDKVNLVTASGLKRLFQHYANNSQYNIECVLLNACYSHEQAKAISECIPYVVGMKKTVGDKIAIEFAVTFYEALGEGESYENAFERGCIKINQTGIPENDIPKLFKRKVSVTQPVTNPDYRNKIDRIIDQISDRLLYGTIVPFLGPGTNADFYIELAHCLVPLIKDYLNGNTSSQENWIPQLIGIPCQICPYENRPEECPVLKDIKAQSYCLLKLLEGPVLKDIKAESYCLLKLLDREQNLAIAIMNLRYLSQYFYLKVGGSFFYKKIRDIADKIESNHPNAIHQFFAKLPDLMKRKDDKELPYPIIITTNYDNLLERAFKKVGQEYDVLYYDAQERKFKHKFKHQDKDQEEWVYPDYDKLPLADNSRISDPPRPIILKLYGTLEENFVMTQDQINCRAIGGVEQLPNDLLKVIRGEEGFSILFLGYSPGDSELQLISSQIWPSKKLPKPSFMVHQSKLGELDYEIWADKSIKPNEWEQSLEEFIISLETKIEEKINKD